MSLVSSKEAIGAVSEVLRTGVSARLGSLNVLIGRPEVAASNGGRKINLFLYRVGFDSHLRNEPLEMGQQPPLWMVLHYLMTAFDEDKDSDSSDAHRLLGGGLAALQELNFMRPSAPALARNPEPLKITFDDADAELLSKLMQGSEEKYRISAAFQVRPVMIVPEMPASYAPLVKTVGPPKVPQPVPTPVPPIGEGVEVIPSFGPRLKALAPERFAAPAGVSLTLQGLDLGEVTHVQFGSLSLPVTGALANEVTATFPAPSGISAGAYPVTVSRPLTSGHTMTSNALLAHLIPTLTSVGHGTLTLISGRLHGTLSLTGERLGAPTDSIFVAFYRDGAMRLMLEATGSAAQTSLSVIVVEEKALLPGDYLIIVRVNGEQADDAQTVNWT
jgi:hypothetical protein